MRLEQVIRDLELTILTDQKDFSQMEVSEGYASDLLSCVMAGAPHQGLWITLQAHANIVAVAALLELNAVIITENAQPDSATLDRANQENITLLSSQHPTFYIVGKLWEMGIRSN